jgi:glutathione S-transferase
LDRGSRLPLASRSAQGGPTVTGRYTLYSMQDSGNCYKPRLLMRLLGIPFRIVDKDSRDGSTRAADFLALNPNGKVPLLLLPDGRPLAESNAMLLHLAEGTSFLPADAYQRALVYQWLFFEQYSHEPSVAVLRSWLHLSPEIGRRNAERVPDLRRRAEAALHVMENRLSRHDWLAGDGYSVADIALYAYTHLAGEAGFDLARYPGISAWLARIAGQPSHVGIEWRPENG